MDSTDSGANTDESSDERCIVVEIHPHRDINHLEKYDKRHVTDKYWSCFFLIIFISWIVSCEYAARYEIHYNTFYARRIVPKNITQSVDYKNILAENSTATIDISEFRREELKNETKAYNDCLVKKRRKTETTLNENLSVARNWFLDTFTFDLRRLDEKQNYEVMSLAYYLITFVLFFISFLSIYNDPMFYKQPLVIGATLSFAAILEHFSAEYYTNDPITFPGHNDIISWLLPEAMFLVVCILRKCAGISAKERGEPNKHPFHLFTEWGFIIALGVPTFQVFYILMFYTTNLLLEVAWFNSALSYMIIGGSCYIGLTIYYYELMVISCAIQLSEEHKTYPPINLFRALFIVARYHFGTACYNATLIFPRIHATFLIYDKKLKALPESSIFKRFWKTHLEVHGSSTTFSGVIGTDYATSLKELLFIWPKEEIKKYFNFHYKRLSIKLLIFLLTINNKIILLLWTYDIYHSQFITATRTMYIKIVFMFFLACSYLQAIMEAHALLDYRASLRKSANDIFVPIIPEEYFEQASNSSDDETSSDDNDDSDDSGIYNETVF